MPGSVTISHTDALVMLSHSDAERLSTMLSEISTMAEMPGPNRLSEEQISVLCKGKAQPRSEFTEWTRGLAAYLKEHL